MPLFLFLSASRSICADAGLTCRPPRSGTVRANGERPTGAAAPRARAAQGECAQAARPPHRSRGTPPRTLGARSGGQRRAARRKSTPAQARPRLDPTSTRIGLKPALKSTTNQPQIDPTSTRHRPKIGPNSTPNCPNIDPKSTRVSSNVDRSSTQIDPGSSPSRPQRSTPDRP